MALSMPIPIPIPIPISIADVLVRQYFERASRTRRPVVKHLQHRDGQGRCTGPLLGLAKVAHGTRHLARAEFAAVGCDFAERLAGE